MLLWATTEREKRYQEDLARLNDEGIPALTTDLSQERKEVSELMRAVATIKKGRHLVKREAKVERERATSMEERVASVEERATSIVNDNKTSPAFEAEVIEGFAEVY